MIRKGLLVICLNFFVSRPPLLYLHERQFVTSRETVPAVVGDDLVEAVVVRAIGPDGGFGVGLVFGDGTETVVSE